MKLKLAKSNQIVQSILVFCSYLTTLFFLNEKGTTNTIYLGDKGKRKVNKLIDCFSNLVGSDELIFYDKKMIKESGLNQNPEHLALTRKGLNIFLSHIKKCYSF